jgi:hypothetical protein
MKSFSASLIKITGLFAYNTQKDIRRLVEAGYATMPVVQLPDNSQDIKEKTAAATQYEQNLFYKEYRNLMLNGGSDSLNPDGSVNRDAAKIFLRRKELKGELVNKENLLSFTSPTQEVFLFPDGVGLFSLRIQSPDNAPDAISNLTNIARNFDSKIIWEHQPPQLWHAWISQQVLAGIQIVGSKIEVDQFSGSKFKLYMVFDHPEYLDWSPTERQNLLYELGTCTPIGSIDKKDHYAPSDSYFNGIIEKQKFSAFHNYEMLALLDSFTCLGTNNFNELEQNFYSFATWNKSYYYLYVLSLYVHYSLGKYNYKFMEAPVKYRRDFTHFLNKYNIRHLSFNFLPTLIYHKIREGLKIDEELKSFEERLTKLSDTIQEDQNRRQGFLLTIISVLSSFEAVNIILGQVDNIQKQTGIGLGLFYTILCLLVLSAGLALFRFLYPQPFNKAIRQAKPYVRRFKAIFSPARK